MLKSKIQSICCAASLSGLVLSSMGSAQAQAPKQIIPKLPAQPAHGVSAPGRGVPSPARGAVVHPAPVRHASPVVVRQHASEVATHQEVRVENVHANQIVHSGAPGGIIVIAGNTNGRFPRLYAALNALVAANQTMQGGGSNAEATANVQKALHELSQSSSNPLFQGHRQNAIDRSIRAVHLLEKGASFEEPDALTRDAIDDLRFCVSVP